MPKRKKVMTSSESNSNEGEKHKKQKKEEKTPKRDKNESSDEETKKKPSSIQTLRSKAADKEPLWFLGNMRAVRVHEFEDNVYIDIRIMYVAKDQSGAIMPSRNGISLTPAQFYKLVKYLGEIEAIVKARM